ncbi:MAG: hypothetical protein WCD79_15535 [Chthoniobacteraceae bacterium]
MEDYISPSLVAVLLSADPTGLIKIPPGTACEIEDITSQLLVLETVGFLIRPAGTAYNRPFRLTERGAKLKSVLAKEEMATL